MKRILIIAYSYPPLMEAQSIRWAHLSKELVKKGNEVDVLTIRLPSYYDDGLYLVKGVSIHRTYPGPVQSLFFNTKAALHVEDKSYQEKRGSLTHQFLRGGYETLRSVMNFVLIPDLRTEWYPFAIFKLFHLMNKKHFDIVISSHEPGVDHLLGFFAKTFYPIQWIGDFSDPMLTFYTPKMRRPIDQRVQGALLKHMDRVLVTNRRLKEDFLTQYPFLSSERICLLSQGFDEGFWKDADTAVQDKKKLRLVYTGTFYRNERDPLELFKALRDLKGMDLEFLIAGRNDEVVSDAKKFGLLGNKVNYLGYLKYRDSIRVQHEGDVLVHIGNRSSNQVPGKIYEYLGAGKPILAILKNPNDEIKDLILNLKRGVVTPDESSKIKEAISFLWELHKREDLRSSFNLSLEDVNQYSWESLSNLLINGIGGIGDRVEEARRSD
jgi:hypothetical protein